MTILFCLAAVVLALMVLDYRLVADAHDDEIRRRVDRIIARSKRRD